MRSSNLMGIFMSISDDTNSVMQVYWKEQNFLFSLGRES